LPALSDAWNNPGLATGMTHTDDTKKDGLDHPFLYPGMDSIPQGARKAVRLYPGMDSIPQGARKAVRLYPEMDRLKIAPCIFRTPTFLGGRLKIAPCIFRTSHIHVGRILQGTRKAMRVFGDFVNEKYQQKRACDYRAGFVYA
jgi:hypothetical protein